jgi:hypothetical protein
MKKVLLKIIVGFVILLSVVKYSYAQSLEFEIFPAILEVESAPGERIEHQIVLRGSGGENYVLNSYALNVLNNQGQFSSSFDEEVALDWVSFNPKDMTFMGTQERRVNLTIDIPEDASLGDYYLTIALEKEQGMGQPVNIDGMVRGALEIPLLISVTDEGLPQLEARIKEFRGRVIKFQNPLTFNLEVENIGLRKIKSFGKLEIVNLISKTKHTKEFVPQNILSKSSRLVLDEYGFFNGKEHITWQSPTVFGVYSARASIYDRYFVDTDAQLLVSSPEIYFVYINIYLLVTILVMLVILVYIITRKIRNKALTKNKK